MLHLSSWTQTLPMMASGMLGIILVMGVIGRLKLKLNYFTLMGLIAGSNTDPPALAFANATAGNNAPAVGYSTVYPLSMFLRILMAQLVLIFFM